MLHDGDATDFGDLSSARYSLGGCASPTRGIIGGGYLSPAVYKTIEYVNIASTGNVVDFGDLIAGKYGIGGFSDVHGGLG